MADQSTFTMSSNSQLEHNSNLPKKDLEQKPVASEDDLDIVNNFFDSIAAHIEQQEKTQKQEKLEEEAHPIQNETESEPQTQERDSLNNEPSQNQPPAALHPPAKQQKALTKNQKKRLKQKKKSDEKVFVRHSDTFKQASPKNTEDLDFDALLAIHEKATENGKRKLEEDEVDLDNYHKQHPSKKQNMQNKQQTKSQAKNVTKRKSNFVPTLPASMALTSQTNHQTPEEQAVPQAPKTTNSIFEPLPSLEELKNASASGEPKPKRKLENEQSEQQESPKKQKVFVPRKDCVYYMKGHCNKGDQCTFKHDPEKLPVEQPKKVSNIVCQFYKTGSCAKIDCTFSHNLQLEPCRFYHLNSKCSNNQCPYSHAPLDEDGLARLRKLTGPCRYYFMKGYCESEGPCKFSHDLDTPETEIKKVESEILPCTYYHLYNKCKNGDDCFYLHDEATPAQIKSLKEHH